MTGGEVNRENPHRKYSLDHIRPLRLGMAAILDILECLQDLHPELQSILDGELDAGNRVIDASRDWPEEGSVFVTMAEPFRVRHQVPDSVRYDEPGDPHYWKADYSCGDPVHVLAC